MNIWAVHFFLSFVFWGTLQAGEHEVIKQEHSDQLRKPERTLRDEQKPSVKLSPRKNSDPSHEPQRLDTYSASSFESKPLVPPFNVVEKVVGQDQIKKDDTNINVDTAAGKILLGQEVSAIPSVEQSHLSKAADHVMQNIAAILQSSAFTTIENMPLLEQKKSEVARIKESLKELRGYIAEEVTDQKESKKLNKLIDQSFVKLDAFLSKQVVAKATFSTEALSFTAHPSSLPSQYAPAHEGSPLRAFLCGVLTSFPDSFSPSRGDVMVNNGKAEALLKADNATAKKFFYALQDEKAVHPTNLPGNPVIGLSPELLAKLIKIIMVDPKLLLTDDIGLLDEWYASYMDKPLKQQFLKKRTDFNREVRSFMKILYDNTIKNRQQSLDIIVSYVSLQAQIGDPAEIIQRFAKKLGVEFKSEYYTKKDFEDLEKRYAQTAFTSDSIKNELDALLFYVLKSSMNPNAEDFLFDPNGAAEYKGFNFTACQENTIRTLMSMILFNPVTKCLDLSVLPQHIQDSIPAETKEFVKKYGDLQKKADVSIEGKLEAKRYESAATKAYMNLVQNRDGIEYIQKRIGPDKTEVKYELAATNENTVQILKMLFGLHDVSDVLAVEELENIIKGFSTDARKFSIYSKAGDFIIGLEIPEQSFKVAGTFSWYIEHADVAFHSDTRIVNGTLVKNIYLAGKALDQYILGAYDITLSLSLYHLIHESVLKTKEDFVDLFSQYTSQFDQAIPEVFYGEHWGNLFKNIPDDVAFNLLEAAVENGFDKSSGKGILLEAFRAACEKKNFLTVTKLLDFGTKPSALILELIVTSPFSDMQKRTLLKRLRDTGLASDDICSLLMKASSKNILLLVQSGVDINAFNSQGNTPLILAASTYNELAFDPLITAGAKVDMPNTAGKTISDVLVDAVQESLVFFKTLTTIDSWKEQSDQFFKMGKLENMMETLIALPDARINAADKKRLERALKDFSEGRAQAEMNYEKLHS